MSLPTHIPEPQSQWAFVFLLLSFSPIAIATQFRTAISRIVGKFHPDLYVLILSGVVVGDGSVMGWISLREALSRNVMLGIVAGMGAGFACICSERLLLRAWRHFQIPSVPALGYALPRVVFRNRPSTTEFTLLDLILIATLEECIYRHYLALLLGKFIPGVLVAGVVTSVAYGLMHEYFGRANVFAKTVTGGILFAIRWTSGSLLVTILGHVLLNVAAHLSNRYGFTSQRLKAQTP